MKTQSGARLLRGVLRPAARRADLARPVSRLRLIRALSLSLVPVT